MRALAALLLFCLSALPLFAADPTYAALRASRPDGRTISVTDFVFERDVFRFTLSGKIHLFTPVDGKTSGAIFIGQGSYELKPANELERRQLAIYTADDKLTSIVDQFESAVFLGTAFPAAAEKAGAPVAGAVDPKAVDRWEEYLKKQRRDLHTNVQIRLLQELVDIQDPFFLTWVNGKKYPPAVLIVDPRGAESVRLTSDLGGEQTLMRVYDNTKGGIWYSNRLRSEIEAGQGMIIRPLADAEHYVIESTIDGAQISAMTTMTFTPAFDIRVLPLELTARLRLTEAAFAPAGDAPAWTSAEIVQERAEDDPDAAVIFPTPLKAGQKYLLRTTYAGKDVLDNAGEGNFTVMSRTSWYPNVGTFSDLATYDLTFNTPEKFQIVAVGAETSNRVEGKRRIANWKTPHAVRVAGFNYGKFKKLAETDKESGTTFEVYTNPGTPDIIREINAYLAGDGGLPSLDHASLGPQVQVNTASLAQSAMADGINTMRTGNAFFGPLANKRVAITQQSQWFSGQSWPTLIYMPYLAFLNGTQRNTLGLNQAKDFIDNVGPHEVAHQWWGHQVGWKTYRDQWLSEGFAEFTSAVVAQQTGGWNRYNAFWENARKNILERPTGAQITNQEAGPISQGWRLSTWRNPNAYGAIVYSKGAYVLHMLRMAMYDMKKGDEAFITMMRDYASTFADKSPTTEDFQRIVEKHAPQSLRLTSDNKLDWFFGQWVYGTAIPKYTSKFDFSDAGGGKYKVTGSMTQSEVPANFAVVMPIYVHFDKNSFVKLGSMVLVGNQTKPVEFEIALPQKPMKFSINAMHDVLAR